MEKFDDKIKGRKFDNFQFVPFLQTVNMVEDAEVEFAYALEATRFYLMHAALFSFVCLVGCLFVVVVVFYCSDVLGFILLLLGSNCLVKMHLWKFRINSWRSRSWATCEKDASWAEVRRHLSREIIV
jgi:hypothetical protein